MRVAIIERNEKVLEELKKGLKRVDPNYEISGDCRERTVCI